MAILRYTNLLVSFLLELATLAAVGYWGFHLHHTPVVMRWCVGLGLPVVVALLWAKFLAPNSPSRFPRTVTIVVSFIVFLVAATLLYIAGQETLAWVMAGVVIANMLLKFAFKQ